MPRLAMLRQPARIATLVALMPIALMGLSPAAHALSLRVKLACATDYYAHCSQYSTSSPEVRQCMRAVGVGLSKGCVEALLSAGEVTPDEVARHRAAAKQAQR